MSENHPKLEKYYIASKTINCDNPQVTAFTHQLMITKFVNFLYSRKRKYYSNALFYGKQIRADMDTEVVGQLGRPTRSPVR